MGRGAGRGWEDCWHFRFPARSLAAALARGRIWLCAANIPRVSEPSVYTAESQTAFASTALTSAGWPAARGIPTRLSRN